MATLKVDLDPADIPLVCNALTLARASALRLSNRPGCPPDAVVAYRNEYNKLNALMMKFSHYATKGA